MTRFIIIVITTFVCMEFISIFMHRFLFHNFFWFLHKSHHYPRRGTFEWNDVFPVIFASTAISMMVFAEDFFLESISFPIGLGVSLYGMCYFVIHDMLVHRRFIPFTTKNKLLLTLRAAHQYHHQTVDKKGHAPFGLFIFPYSEFKKRVKL